MTGQQIDPKDLRPGDRVRVTDTWAFTIKDHGLADRDSAYESFHDSGVDKEWGRTWELIERPKPEAKLGSVWVDPEDKAANFIYIGAGVYTRTGGGFEWHPSDGHYGKFIARLVPAEDQTAGDLSGMAHCVARLYEHRCGLGPDHDGMHNDGRGYRWAEEQA